MLIAASILIAGLIICFTIHRGFKRMSETIDLAEQHLTEAVSNVITDVATVLADLANSLAEHTANGTVASTIQAQADKLTALDASIKAVLPAPTGDDTITAPAGDDSVTAPSGSDTVAGS